MWVSIWPSSLQPKTKEESPEWQLQEGCLLTFCLHSEVRHPASPGPIQTQTRLDYICAFCQARLQRPPDFSSSQPVAIKEAAEKVMTQEEGRSLYPKAAFRSLRLLPFSSLILLQGSPTSCLSLPLASLALAPQGHQHLCQVPHGPAHRTLWDPLPVVSPSVACGQPLIARVSHWLCCCVQAGPSQGPVLLLHFRNFALKGKLPKSQIFVSFVP